MRLTRFFVKKRIENEDEVSCEKIRKMMERIEENKDIKTVTEVVSRIVKSEKEAPKKISGSSSR